MSTVKTILSKDSEYCSMKYSSLQSPQHTLIPVMLMDKIETAKNMGN